MGDESPEVRAATGTEPLTHDFLGQRLQGLVALPLRRSAPPERVDSTWLGTAAPQRASFELREEEQPLRGTRQPPVKCPAPRHQAPGLSLL